MTRKLIITLLILVLGAAGCRPSSQPTPGASPSATLPTAASATPSATSLPQATATPTPSPTPSVTPIPSPTPSGAWMQLIPDSAAPGAQVTIQGYLPGGPDQASAQNDETLSHANVCWQSCLGGFIELNQPVAWSPSEAGHFSINFTVPAIPWVSAGGPVPLTPGDYPVAVQCLGGEIQGCALTEGQASATLHLSGPASTRCGEGQPCTEMQFTPDQAAPGATVQVSGWAPLVQTIGGQPTGYYLAVETKDTNQPTVQLGQIQQQADGSFSGTFIVPQALPGVGPLGNGPHNLVLQTYLPQPPPENGKTVLIGSTPLTITAPPAWQGLGFAKPLWIEPAASLIQSVMASDPAQPGRLAYCAPGAIQVSQDSGKTWTKVPTGGVAPLAKSSGYTLVQNSTEGGATCLSVTLDAAHPHSFFAVFQTANQAYGAPPVFFMGYATPDDGKTWTAVPPPDSSSVEDFGGFWANGEGTVQALYNQTLSPAPATGEGATNPGAAEQAPTVLVQQTTDGGQSWSVGTLMCPPTGPCLRWGAAPGSIPGMGSPLPQWVYESPDGGQTWSATGLSVELRLPSPGQLVAFSDQDAALVSGEGEFPLRFTRDGGQSWQVAALPSLPESDTSGPLYSGLQILDSGALLAQSADQVWHSLAPGGSAWCSLGKTNLPDFAQQLQPAGGKLWWLSPADNLPASQSLKGLACGG